MNTEPISMVQECVSRYAVREHADGSATVTIEVPAQYADLWRVRLSELRTTREEIESYSKSDEPEPH